LFQISKFQGAAHRLVEAQITKYSAMHPIDKSILTAILCAFVATPIIWLIAIGGLPLTAIVCKWLGI